MSCTEIFQNLYLSCPQRFQSSKTKKEKKILKDFLNCLVLAGLTETPRVICLLCPVVLPLSPSCLWLKAYWKASPYWLRWFALGWNRMCLKPCHNWTYQLFVHCRLYCGLIDQVSIISVSVLNPAWCQVMFKCLSKFALVKNFNKISFCTFIY